jgi:hypothetical protein
MINKILLSTSILLILFSCEKVKEQADVPPPGNIKKYAIGMKFSTDVFPSLSNPNKCAKCHNDPADKDFTDVAGAYTVLSDNALNKLPSQPTATISDSVNYWKQADSLVQICKFKVFTSAGTTHGGGAITFTDAEYNKIYGWIIEGGANN